MNTPVAQLAFCQQRSIIWEFW